MKKTDSKEKKKQDRYKKFAKALADPRTTNDNKKKKMFQIGKVNK